MNSCTVFGSWEITENKNIYDFKAEKALRGDNKAVVKGHVRALLGYNNRQLML